MSLVKSIVNFIKSRFSKKCCSNEETPVKVEAPKIEIIPPIVKETPVITIEPVKIQPIVEVTTEQPQENKTESHPIIEPIPVVAPIIKPSIEQVQEIIITPIETKVEPQPITIIPVVEDIVILDKPVESIAKTDDITISTVIPEIQQSTASIEITVDALSEIVTPEDIIINKALAKKQPVKKQTKETTPKKTTKKSNVVVVPAIKESAPVAPKKPTKRKK